MADVSLSSDAVVAIASQVERWLDQVVIGLNLCPFAAEPRRQQQIRLQVSRATEPEGWLMELQSELQLLSQVSPAELETTLLIIPQGLEDFEDYNEFLGLAELLLQEFGWEGEFQIASFHPHYQFEGTQPEDVENLTNRSPYPLLHILREASIEEAIAHYPHPESIPKRNIEQVRSLSATQRQQLFPELF